jgi:succinate-semialdehyde dehydrogenase/glutarate-semialdehyde dehydrogenase
MQNKTLLINKAYINGEWLDANDGKTFAVTNPATDALIAEVPDMGKAETQTAIEAAHQAFPLWKNKTAEERAILLRKWFDLLIANVDDLGELLTTEQGKPLAEAKGEIRYGASYIEWFAEEARRIYGDVIPGHSADKRILVIKQPVGVVGIITPWNFPNAMLARKVAAALAAGCTTVIKPAEATPLSALALAFLAEQAGIPKGVINIVTTSTPSVVGSELTRNPLVRKISFTGSTAVGKLLMKQCADTVKKMSMELGGNAPFIVFDDADLDDAVQGAMISKFRNAGQTCVCANRLYVQSGVYDAFVEKLSVAVAQLKVGNGMESGMNIGPLIDEKALAKVNGLVADALSKGATITTGGKNQALGKTFYEPTILANATTDMRLTNEEIFGPVAPIYRFDTEGAVIELANATEFGLAAYFFGQNINRIWRVAEALEYGMVGINTGLISTPVAPFGGIKESGFGREGSKYGLDDYLEIKYLCFGNVR